MFFAVCIVFVYSISLIMKNNAVFVKILYFCITFYLDTGFDGMYNLVIISLLF